MATNVSYVMQPHFKSNCFRAAVKNQHGGEFNFVVITCSPEYNGVWKYNAALAPEFEIWMNGKTPCYCVPIEVCTRIRTLDELVNPVVIAAVKEQQNKWYKNQVKNVEHQYKNKPSWMLK